MEIQDVKPDSVTVYTRAIKRKAEILKLDAERPPVRHTMKQRLEEIISLTENLERVLASRGVA